MGEFLLLAECGHENTDEKAALLAALIYRKILAFT
jgi:hypothetical protein